MGFDVTQIRKDFSVIEKKIDGKPIIYLDSACQSLRPVQVIEKINQYYSDYPGCAGRSNHKIGRRVEEEVVSSRGKLSKFFGCKPSEVVFTRNTTESINLVANSIDLKEGDSVLISDKEHNSNLVPWLQLSKTKRIKVEKFSYGDLSDFQEKLNKNTKLVSVAHVSNLDGTVNPIKEMSKLAHENNSLVLIDAAQSAPHKELNVRDFGVDFMACSGHKMLGPSGIGMLFISENVVGDMQPFMTGGETVIDTSYDSAVFEKMPERYEAGLQNYAGMLGFGEAVEYLKRIGMKNIEQHEKKLNKLTTELLSDVVEVFGPSDSEKRNGIFGFNIKGMNYHDVALLLDSSKNIMVRSGQHCVHSWFHSHNVEGTVRASFYIYNTEDECKEFAEAIKNIISL